MRFQRNESDVLRGRINSIRPTHLQRTLDLFVVVIAVVSFIIMIVKAFTTITTRTITVKDLRMGIQYGIHRNKYRKQRRAREVCILIIETYRYFVFLFSFFCYPIPSNYYYNYYLCWFIFLHFYHATPFTDFSIRRPETMYLFIFSYSTRKFCITHRRSRRSAIPPSRTHIYRIPRY